MVVSGGIVGGGRKPESRVKRFQRWLQNERVVLLGDGEFDGINLQAIVNECQWGYVCRTARNAQLFWQDQAFHFDDLDECLSPGGCVELDQVRFTKKLYAIQDRDLLLGPEGPWIQSSQKPPFRSSVLVSADDRDLSISGLGLQASNCQATPLCSHTLTLERILMNRERTPSDKPLLDTL